jgi:hypothetical protein
VVGQAVFAKQFDGFVANFQRGFCKKGFSQAQSSSGPAVGMPRTRAHHLTGDPQFGAEVRNLNCRGLT